jgi:hypothetical protein
MNESFFNLIESVPTCDSFEIVAKENCSRGKLEKNSEEI